MADEKKRFPWWLVVCAVLLVPLAAVVGLIETVGRQGTIVGRCERVKPGMLDTEARAILGPPDEEDSHVFGVYGSVWREGPIVVIVQWEQWNQFAPRYVYDASCWVVSGRSDPWWHVRRWAEQAYTAIHGPRH
jgi:hypothetical protein